MMRDLLDSPAIDDRPHSYNESQLPASLKTFTLLAIGLTVLSLAFVVVCRLLGLGLPYTAAYYFVPGDMLNDFIGFHHKFVLYGRPEFFTTREGYVMYPAPMVVLIHFFHHPLIRRTLLLFIPCMTLIVGSLVYGFYRALKKVAFPRAWLGLFVAVVVITSYPLMFEIQRANMEVVVWLFTALGVWAFYRERPYLAAIAVGVAIACKLYPFILLGMFLSAKRYRAMALAIAVAGGLVFASYAAIGPTVHDAYVWNSTNLAMFSKYYAGRISHLGFDHSLFGLVKFLSLKRIDLQGWVRPYTMVAAGASLIVYFARLWRLPLPNQIVALSILSIILPPVSYDYTLLNLYPAFAVLVCLAIRAQQAGMTLPHMTTYMVLFAIVFTPESYVILFGAAYGAQVRAVALIVMLVLALRWPLPTESELIATPVRHNTVALAA